MNDLHTFKYAFATSKLFLIVPAPQVGDVFIGKHYLEKNQMHHLHEAKPTDRGL